MVFRMRKKGGTGVPPGGRRAPEARMVGATPVDSGAGVARWRRKPDPSAPGQALASDRSLLKPRQFVDGAR